jgi:phosphoribosylamine-glycine ligase
MASILVLSQKGEGLDLVNRFQQEGHLVKGFVKEYPLVDLDFRVGQIAMLEQYDIILSLTPGMGPTCEGIETRPVIGGNNLSDKLFTDKGFKEKVVRELLPIQFDKDLDGIFIGTEGWFNGDGFVLYNHFFSYHSLMECDRGPLTPGMGVTLWTCQEDELVKRSLLPLCELLHRSRYKGPVSTILKACEDDLQLIDLNLHVLYDNIEAMLELLPKGLFNFLHSLVSKGEIISRGDYAIAVRVTLPPYPHAGEAPLNHNCLEYPEPARHHIFEMPKGTLVMGCATARSTDLRECRRRVYRTLKRCVKHPEAQYRGDIGLWCDDKIGKLKQWGWLDV